MADIFRSALNYISQTGKSDNNFVGQYVELGPVQLRVRRVIAEGQLLSYLWIRFEADYHLFLAVIVVTDLMVF